MKRGSLLVALCESLYAPLIPAILLSATTLFSGTLLLADDEPLILGPPPAPAQPATPAPAQPVPIQIAPPPTVAPQPVGPQLGGPAPAPTPAGPIPFVPVPQASGKPTPPSVPMGVTSDGKPIFSDSPPDSPLLNPDGSPVPGGLTPVPEGAALDANPGPPRLRMSEEKDPKNPKDPKDHGPVEGGPAVIPASLVFRTREIIRPDLLRGRNYRLAEYAPLVDFNFRFEIETPWGTIPAQGLAMLELRLRELCALEYGSRIAEKNPQYTAGFAQGVCNTAQGAYIFVTDPVGSVRRTGEVLQRWALTKKSPGGCKANCEARRRIACLIGCDPETRNEPLACLLDDMTINATGGWLTVSVGLNFGLPGLGFVPFNTEFKKIMEHRSTLEIQADLDAALIELGIPEASRTRFFACLNYTTTERMAFVFYLRKLIGIENIASLVDGAADTHNESEAMAAIRELQLIADLRHTRDLARVTFIGVPVLTLDDGTQIIVTVADYLVETPRTAQMIAVYRKTFAEVPTKLATFGRVSIGAQKQFKDADIEVIRHKLGPDSPLAGKKPPRTASATPAAPATRADVLAAPSTAASTAAPSRS
ncbi:MAG TPA: hypothetical protein VFG04_12365 [Planctomycetaceae bacterium]|jgi:hypothetical protein|nr:hypothetical protein [Planctomycetaceae bacterium]